MTAICPAGGPSGPKSGTSLFINLAQGGSSLLASRSSWGWLSRFAPVLGVIPIDASAFCGTDPPGFQSLTGEELQSLLSADVFSTVAASAREKLRDNILTMAWYEFCECTGGGTPAEPSAETPPADLPVVIRPSAQACATQSSGVLHFGAGVPGRNVNVVGVVALDGSSGMLIPAGATLMRLTLTMIADGAVHSPVSFAYKYWPNDIDAAIRIATAYSFPSPPSGTVVVDFDVPVNAYKLTLAAQSAINDQTDDISARIDFYCGVSPGDDVDNCTPDYVNNALLQQIYEIVTLIQRQAAPFAFIEGAAHAGLTGDGELTVEGLIGWRIELTTVPDYIGRRGDDPEVLFDAAWWTWGTDDGLGRLEPVRYRGALVLPPAAGAMTRVAYVLSAGVVATLTELKREP